MRRWFLLPLLLTACEADSTGLDAGARHDAGPLSDATVITDAGGPFDSGEGVDAGSPPDSGTTARCEEAAPFGFGAFGFDRDGYEGLLVPSPTDAIRFETPDASRNVTFHTRPPNGFDINASYWVRVEIHQPFWTEVRVTFWRLGPNGGPADLALVAFSGGNFASGTVGEVSYAAIDADCVAEDEGCGLAHGLDIEFSVRGEARRVARGVEVSEPTYTLFNGDSHVFRDGAECEDRPNRWVEGWIALGSARPQPCGFLRRDDCITDPRCILWGSERDDPGYVCVEAQGECEVLGPDACRANPVCAWDIGDCYCPEGAVCACGGGPGPKCRSVCGGFAGLQCPDGRYCDDADVHPADMCLPVPDGGGVCEWVPDTCAGAPNGDVCACSEDRVRTFANDCLRRRAEASGVVRGACPP